MSWLINLFLNAAAVLAAAYILPGVAVQSFWTALLAAFLLAIANALLRPILLFFALPLNVLTLGLFTFAVDAIILLVVAAVLPGMTIGNFAWALLFALVLALLSYLFHRSEERRVGKECRSRWS